MGFTSAASGEGPGASTTPMRLPHRLSPALRQASWAPTASTLNLSERPPRLRVTSPEARGVPYPARGPIPSDHPVAPVKIHSVHRGRIEAPGPSPAHSEDVSVRGSNPRPGHHSEHPVDQPSAEGDLIRLRHRARSPSGAGMVAHPHKILYPGRRPGSEDANRGNRSQTVDQQSSHRKRASVIRARKNSRSPIGLFT
jgi:hypothetical protein